MRNPDLVKWTWNLLYIGSFIVHWSILENYLPVCIAVILVNTKRSDVLKLCLVSNLKGEGGNE